MLAAVALDGFVVSMLLPAQTRGPSSESSATLAVELSG
jgi:hypothetical protein